MTVMPPGGGDFYPHRFFLAIREREMEQKPQKAAGGNQLWQPAETPGDERQPENSS